MSARAVIDSLEFAHGGKELRGDVQVVELGRLADSVYDCSGTLQYTLVGHTDGRQRPRLRLRVAGAIGLRCQRCLGKLPYQVALDASLLLLSEDSGSDTAEVEDLDAVAADPALDVWSLVEDEVLLALPIAPRHPEGECELVAGADRDRAASPFAVLAGLKQKRVN
jgi:uncharacterized protein